MAFTKSLSIKSELELSIGIHVRHGTLYTIDLAKESGDVISHRQSLLQHLRFELDASFLVLIV
jgi:hypothetical protein